MWGFWKGGPAVLSENLVMGLMGVLAKLSFRAFRLPAGGGGSCDQLFKRRRAERGGDKRDKGGGRQTSMQQRPRRRVTGPRPGPPSSALI